MPRKRTTRDFAITMDEFHPSPSTAAAFSDRKANQATLDNLSTALKRIDARLETEPKQFHAVLRSDRAELVAQVALTRADLARTEELIAEAKVK